MNKLKIFQNHDKEELEADFNVWSEEHYGIEIVKMDADTIMYGDLPIYVITIIYKEN